MKQKRPLHHIELRFARDLLAKHQMSAGYDITQDNLDLMVSYREHLLEKLSPPQQMLSQTANMIMLMRRRLP